MSTLPVTPWITADEFAQMPEYRHGYELIDGRPVRDLGNTKPSHELVKRALARALYAYEATRPKGELAVDVESPYQFAQHTVRMPDLSIQVPERELSKDELRFYPKHAPEIMIEILSPGNSAREIDRKVRLFFDHGTKVAWVLDPEARRAFTILASGQWRDIVSLETELLPDLEVTVELLWSKGRSLRSGSRT